MAKRIFAELKDYNDQFEPKVNYEAISFCAEENDEFIGGIEGYMAWDAFEITNMIVLKKGQGIGRKLLNRLEEFVKEKGVTKIKAWTLDFQSPGFYKKCGYETFAVIPNFAGEHSCHYLIKRL